MKTAPVNFHSLKREIDELSLDPAAKLGLRLAFLAIGLQFIVIALFWHRLPPEVPLLYSRAYGDAQLVNNFWLWLLPLLTFILELISIRLAAKARTDHQLWSQMLSWTGAVIAIMGLTTLVKIISLMI
ncbi:hypothetical protein COW80_01520 [Candidatus Beckwithbacteria bacterium CG22_combo_CG10-13_8_21_14_all_01_47_9]|uniref:DUF1648 domain-containing protein n=4 Tax=Candidatus Beckwithiibacteriota TaxID=1752726 RepID=A0A2H0E1C0_9BACT|nr:MAG: hypothetical protein AUJ59_04285 [Candidatus Beckwithbacteria bacterium CG1_02_47_37]PIP51749.1 MAG: hypothetical protein COX09_05360 [Candidatus Beckwithbacteria bacterium CG23_combo_of_CG06-09_8_20_14_all_47_9]PIP88224.1 MAG: hypothetical protein COW80_01520 [Candidatus Beckwithbacteria bacterium CG22_combo_CG10-13_8_21_14_all_01_47_9]PJA23247.1 MAG: hypothetical protein COX59_00885 [Candidatus Beckwithbacteria bacterium CG_4_10_14_0_2_um_filter_47_25]